MRVIVVVTKELADRHPYMDSRDCPLFHALQDAGLNVVSVEGMGTYTIGLKRYTFPQVAGVDPERLGDLWAWTAGTNMRVKESGVPFIFFHDDELGPIMPSDKESPYVRPDMSEVITKEEVVSNVNP